MCNIDFVKMASKKVAGSPPWLDVARNIFEQLASKDAKGAPGMNIFGDLDTPCCKEAPSSRKAGFVRLRSKKHFSHEFIQVVIVRDPEGKPVHFRTPRSGIPR